MWCAGYWELGTGNPVRAILLWDPPSSSWFRDGCSPDTINLLRVPMYEYTKDEKCGIITRLYEGERAAETQV